MVTSIRDGAKAIIQYVLDEAVNRENLRSIIKVDDNELSKTLDFDKSERYVVCIQYLEEKNLVSSTETKDGRLLGLTAAAIDFLEQP